MASKCPVNSRMSITVVLRKLTGGSVEASSPNLPGLHIEGPDAAVREDLFILLQEMLSHMLLGPVAVTLTGEVTGEGAADCLLLFEAALPASPAL